MILLFFLLSAVAAQDNNKQVKSLVVFGDGFSDNGLDPDSEDMHGFGGVSNGEVWSDHLAFLLFKGTEGEACYKHKAINYAYTGATTGWANEEFRGWSGLLWQVEQFDCHCNTDSLIEKCTVILQFPGLNAISTGVAQPSEMLEDFKTAVDILMKKGVKNLIILGIIDPAKVPKYADRNVADIVSRLNKDAFEWLYSRKCKQDQTVEENGCYIGIKYAENFLDAVKSRMDVSERTLLASMRDSNSNLVTRGRYNQFHRFMWFDDAHLTTEAHRELAQMLYDEITRPEKAPGAIVKKQEDPVTEEEETALLNIFRKV